MKPQKTMKNNSKEADRNQDPPEFAVKFANAVFVFGVLFSILVVIYAIYRKYIPIYDVALGDKQIQKFYFLCILFGGISTTLFGLGLRLSNRLKVNLSVLVVTIGISVYAFETYLEFSPLRIKLKTQQNIRQETKTLQQLTEKLGVQFDARSKMEVLTDLRKDGVDAYPNIHPSLLIRDPSLRNGLNSRKNTKIFPLGGISNKVMIQDNESGSWMIYRSDEHGFHNAKGVYQNDTIDIVMTGDSFTEGWSVKSNENVSARLSELGYKVINLGKSGNGPLLEYAILKEYIESIKPKIVLWAYYENDLANIRNEMKSFLLMRYLNENSFSQNLISRQNEIDSVLIYYINQEYEKRVMMNDTKGFALKNQHFEIEETSIDTTVEQSKAIQITEQVREEQIETKTNKTEYVINYWLIRIFKLTNFRKMINLTPQPDIERVFFNIAKKSKNIVSKWGGKIYFIYLPGWNTYSTGKEHNSREYVLRTVTELDIPVIDIHKEVFASHPDPLSLFPFRLFGHYNADGYRLVAEAITKKLKADGIMPTN